MVQVDFRISAVGLSGRSFKDCLASCVKSRAVSIVETMASSDLTSIKASSLLSLLMGLLKRSFKASPFGPLRVSNNGKSVNAFQHVVS